MSTLLHIDSSPLGETSISRNLSSEFVRRWKQANPNGEVITRDLTATQFPGINAQWIGAVYTPPNSQTHVQRELLALSDTLISELEQADEWVFGVPMHNFSVPTVFKLWLDQVVRAGRTFSYINGTPVGLLKNQKSALHARVRWCVRPWLAGRVVRLRSALPAGHLRLHGGNGRQLSPSRWRRCDQHRQDRSANFPAAPHRFHPGAVPAGVKCCQQTREDTY
jgi:FMN-dependent NADH-azoreductase